MINLAINPMVNLILKKTSKDFLNYWSFVDRYIHGTFYLRVRASHETLSFMDH